MKALLSEVERDMRGLFEKGWTVLQARQRYPRCHWEQITDAYFAVVVERHMTYTARLAQALDKEAKARGLSRAAVARGALEALAASDLLGAAVDGRLPPRSISIDNKRSGKIITYEAHR